MWQAAILSWAMRNMVKIIAIASLLILPAMTQASVFIYPSHVTGSMTISMGSNVTKAQIEKSCENALAKEHNVSDMYVSATAVQNRRLRRLGREDLTDERRLSSTWTVKFIISVPANQAEAAESKALALLADSSTLKAAIEREAIALGVSEQDAEVNIISFAGLEMETPGAAKFTIGGAKADEDDSNVGVYILIAGAIAVAIIVVVVAVVCFLKRFRRRARVAKKDCTDIVATGPEDPVAPIVDAYPIDVEQPEESRKQSCEDPVSNIVDHVEVVEKAEVVQQIPVEAPSSTRPKVTALRTASPILVDLDEIADRICDEHGISTTTGKPKILESL